MTVLTEKEKIIAEILREKLLPNNATLKEHSNKLEDIKVNGLLGIPLDKQEEYKISLNYIKGYCTGFMEIGNLVLKLMNMDEQEVKDWLEEERLMQRENDKKMQNFINKNKLG